MSIKVFGFGASGGTNGQRHSDLGVKEPIELWA